MLAGVRLTPPSRVFLCARQHFRRFTMFSRAAFSVVAGRAAASVRNPPIVLDLAGPGRPCPVVVDEEPEDPSIPLPYLAASSAPLARDVLPPALALSPEQEAFRRQTVGEVRSTFEVCAATGAIRTYEGILRGIAPKSRSS